MTSKKHLIAIAGTTAIGKTALSIKLAQHYQCPIISCDSRQFFKEMSIGTAAPTKEELDSATHYFIHHKSIFDHYSVGDFEREAIEKLDQLYKEFDIVIMVGGSGLYADAVIKGLDNFPDLDPQIRQNLNTQYDQKGIKSLQIQLQKLDPEHYKKVDINNPHRLIRALEITIGTGKPYSSFLNQKSANRSFETIKIGLNADRAIIYDRINRRVQIMIEQGLLEEAKSLYPHKSLNALQTVGYRELFVHFDGFCTLEHAIAEIQKNTRRFAKRQLTWYRKDTTIEWFDYMANISEITDHIEKNRCC